MRQTGRSGPGGAEKGRGAHGALRASAERSSQGRLCSGTVTLADFTVGSYLELAEAAHYPLKPYAEIWRWYRNIESLPEWQRSAPKNLTEPR
jgi:glutathione S-transferase